MSKGWIVAMVFVGLMGAPSISAQSPTQGTLLFEIEIDQSSVNLDANGQAFIDLIFHDRSLDNPGGVDPAAAIPAINQHRTSWKVIPVEPAVAPAGWSITKPSAMTTVGGESVADDVVVAVTSQAQQLSYTFDIRATVRPTDGREPVELSVRIKAISEGLLTYQLSIPTVPTIGPREFVDVPLKITNLGVFQRTYTFEVAGNECEIPLAFPSRVYLPAKTQETFFITMEGPDDKFWYLTESCLIQLRASVEGVPGTDQTVTMVVVLEGSGIFLEHYLLAFIILLVVLLLLLLLKRRKEKIEEEILGKPQKPWTIPAEKVYLEALKEKDERAWYVVRKYLMEEEYASAVLWYKAYKKATKGSRAKERHIVREERSFRRWQKRAQKQVAKPQLQADRFEAKLQKKLDRKVKKDHRKALRAWKKETKKLEAAHDKKVDKAMEKWEKQVKRAERKGLDLPAEPDLEPPIYPAEPSAGATFLRDHKWQAKADKVHARAAKKEARLQAKYDKEEGKRLHKVRKRVQRMAKKLDDPDFVAEHPLLQPGAGAADAS